MLTRVQIDQAIIIETPWSVSIRRGIFVGQPCMYLPNKASNLGASHQDGDRIILRNEHQIYRAINVVFNIYNKFM